MEYSLEEKILIWLSSFDFLGIAKIYTLLENYPSCVELYKAIENRDIKVIKLLDNHFEQVFEKADDNYIESFIKNLKSQNVSCLTIKSKDFPKQLLQIYQCPINLYLKGDKKLLNTRCLAVVGTRTPSNYGKAVTHDFAFSLAKAGLTIVSGLAFGVDKIAHESSLEANGKTIAVLGSGFNHIYPALNSNLACEIEQKGLLVSEYPPSTTPQKYTFPARNRIVAGLCEGILLTEAGIKSGTLYTKEYAIDFNRNVYVVPGNITSAFSAGTNKILQTCQGACVLSYKDILQDLGISDTNQGESIQLSIDEKLIFSYIEEGQIHYDELLLKTQFPAKTLNSYLTYMAIRGIIKKLPGNFYSI